MATRLLHGIQLFEQFWKGTTQGSSLWSFIKIGQGVKEEMSFDVIVDGRTDAGRRAMSTYVLMWAKKYCTHSYSSCTLHFSSMRSICIWILKSIPQRIVMLRTRLPGRIHAHAYHYYIPFTFRRGRRRFPLENLVKYRGTGPCGFRQEVFPKM